MTPTGVNTFLTGFTSPVCGWAASVSASSVNACWTSKVSPVSRNLYTYVGMERSTIPARPVPRGRRPPTHRRRSLASVVTLDPMQVRTAVIPAAGMGTRFLPASKAVPKELLPIGDTPTLQLVIDEALGAGIDHIVVVSSRNKPAIEAYFAPSPEIIAALEASGKAALAERVRSIGSDWRATIVYQDEAARPRSRGRVRPGGRRRRAVRRPAARRADGRLVAAGPDERGVREHRRQRRRRSRRCPHEDVGRYGVIAPTGPVDADGVVPIGDMVEKPPVDEAPSDLIIIGRYVLTPDVFDEIAAGRTGPSARSS